MTRHEHELLAVTDTLIQRYSILNRLKYERKSIRSDNAGKLPKRREGKSPAPIELIDVDVDVSAKLHELHADIARSIGQRVLPTRDGATLTLWFATHATRIVATIDWVDDLVENLRSLVDQLTHTIEEREPVGDLPTRRVPRFVTAVQASRILSSHIAPVAPATIRRWASDGKVRIVGKHKHSNLFDLAELRSYLKRVRRLSH